MEGQPPQFVNSCVTNAEAAVKKVDPEATAGDTVISDPVSVDVRAVVDGSATTPNQALAVEKTGTIEVQSNWRDDPKMQTILGTTGTSIASSGGSGDAVDSGSSRLLPGAITVLMIAVFAAQ